ncbi:callose synthase 9 [Senna tora]|uniref:Callose synthase 9 n=1 Tax=Senna tora TaxID=362788 RepID=A0A834X3Q8_9FABA|nr:callose synthase 9 [Senna tora]
MTSSRQDKPSSWVSERVSYADIVKNLEGGVGRRDDNGSEGRSRNGIRESLAPQNKFKKTLKIHLDPNGRRRVEWVLERRVQQPRSPLRLALSKGPPEIHKSQQQPKKRVNWALHDTTRKNGTKRANESRVEELGQVKAQSSLKKVVNGSDGGRNEAIRPLALTWVAKGVDKVKKGTEVMGSVLGPVSGEGSEYNSSTHASSKGKEVIQEVDLGPSCSGTKGEMTSHSFFDAEALSSDTSDTETVDDDSLISHFENEEGLLIEQLEREFMEEQKQQNKEAEVPLDGFAVLFGGEGEEATHGGSTMSYILLTLSSWFMALSWLFAPYLFNPSGFEWQKVVEDFRDWTNWLLYRGGIGVKGEESWEAWWDEELAHIRSIGSRIAETILSLRFFIFQYGIVYKLHLQGDDTSLTVYGLSWIVLAVLIILFKVFSFSQKISVNFQLLLRFIQGLSFMLALAGLVVAVIFTKLSVPDIFACILAFIPTGWGILSIAAAWKPVMKRVGLWKSIRSIARLYDAGMGMLIFIPIALFSWKQSQYRGIDVSMPHALYFFLVVGFRWYSAASDDESGTNDEPATGHEAEVHEDEEDEEGGAGSSDSDVEEHVEVERRLDHDLSRFEMIYPNYGVDYNNVLENRVDDQDSHIAQLEEENLTMKERLFLMERELGDLRRRLQFLERQNQIVEDVNEEVVENGSDNESEGGSDAPVVGTEKNAEMVDYVPHGRNEDGDANGKVKNDGVSGGIGDVYMEEFIPDNVIANKNEINCEVRNQFVFDEEKDKLKDEKATEGYTR